jgi:hypothetical protein
VKGIVSTVVQYSLDTLDNENDEGADSSLS